MPQEGGRSKLAIAARRAGKTAGLADIARMHVEGKSLQEISSPGFCRATIRKWTAESCAAQLAEAKTNVKHSAQAPRPLRARLARGYESLAPVGGGQGQAKDRVTLPAKTPGSDLDAVNSLLASMTRKRTKTTTPVRRRRTPRQGHGRLTGDPRTRGPRPAQADQVTGPQRGPIQLTVREMTEEQLLALIAQEQAKQQALAVESGRYPRPCRLTVLPKLPRNPRICLGEYYYPDSIRSSEGRLARSSLSSASQAACTPSSRDTLFAIPDAR